jgi:CheY-like chemotaxis protein
MYGGDVMGRPKKVVLVVGADEDATALQKFMLHVVGYRVLVAQDSAAAEELHRLGVDVVLGLGALPGGWCELAEAMKRRHPQVPILLLDAGADVAAANLLLPRRVPCADVLHHLKCLVGRKRGPQALPMVC